MAVRNWDTETADRCKLPDLLPEICERCRDKKYCRRNDNGQMTIGDMIPEEDDDVKRSQT